ncbi:MAG TPA: APC family permease [Streptosporangiaceae bacterium]|nr:APC family permease [Streptosporangiaceae bacterium]HYK70706.1 APC family permease [Streptosporangiaceae bacterium]
MSASPEVSTHDRDTADLARFGYRQELKRSLGTFSSFAVAFSYISPSTGIFTLFALGLTTLGGAFIWTWPVVALGQFIIALNFAEVSSHFPLAGSVFQWSKYMANRAYSWFTGWIYLFAGMLTVTAVVATLPIALIPALNGLGWHSLTPTLHTDLVVALITLAAITVLNIYGVRLVAIINNTGVLFEILGMFVFAIVLMAFHNHQGFHVVNNSGGLHVGANTFLIAMFMSLFVIYGFDTASTLSEETRDPRRAAPKAVLFSIVGAFIIGGVFLLGTLMAIPNLHAAITGNKGLGWGPQNIIEANFSAPFATIYLLVVSAAIFVCCLSIMAATIRLCFGMSRDNQLPFSSTLSRVSPKLHTPVWCCVVVAIIAAIPFIQFSGAGIIAIAATAMIYFSYFMGNLAILRDRLRGWPRTSAPFRLRRWGLVVNILGLVYGGAMLVNFAWPRLASNMTPKQSGVLDFHMGWLNSIPILWTVFVFIVLVGSLYYLIAGRRKEFAPVTLPADEPSPIGGEA